MYSPKTIIHQKRKFIMTVQTQLAPVCIQKQWHCLQVKNWQVMYLATWDWLVPSFSKTTLG